MSTLNRGPLGSAFRINLDPNNGGANPTGRPRPESSATPADSASDRSRTNPGTGPILSANGPIPMPGPTSSPVPGPGFGVSAPVAVQQAPASGTATMEPPTMAPPGAVPVPPPKGSLVTTDLARSLAEVKGQAQFLLYLADQIEDSLHQLVEEHDACQNAFLCRVLSMYSAQLETKHHGLGDKIAETCQEVYVTVRDYDAT